MESNFSREIADRIWNAGAKLTHNELDEILSELTRKAYLQGIRDAKGCVPEEEYVTDCNHTPIDSCDSDCANKSGAIMFNAARKETLEAITRLEESV